MPLLSWSYWFSLHARELMPSAKLAIGMFFAALVVFGIIAKVLSKKKSGSMFWAEGGKRLGAFGVWMGALGLLLVFFMHELIYFFGARFWLLVWAAGALWWLLRIIRFLTAVVPKQSAAYAERARIEKWIPKSR